MAVCYRVLRHAIIACLLATAAWFPRGATIENDQTFFLLRIDLESTTTGVTQLFFDVGQGFNEADSVSQDILSTTRVVPYSFALPAKNIHALRFDPANHAGSFRISNVTVEDFAGHAIRRLPVEKFTATNQIAASHLEGGTLIAETPQDATDPIFDLRLDRAIDLRISFAQRVRAFAFLWLITAVIFLGLLETLCLARVQDLLRPLGRIVALQPVLLIALVAAFAVALQCRPVLFQGMSFVSPNNGSVMFYETFPTLPGSTDKVVEDTKGTDTAALLHQSLYYPSIERKALAQGELPLWNRYFTCGVPLLGQGQSMFGSILNFTTILGDSSALSWDIRFVLNRWLFGFGVGIAVWLLTKSKSSATLSAFLSTFIGYFEFRTVHMAQFGVEIAPWVLVGWLLLRSALTRKQLVGALTILFFANWELFTSGSVKEAYMLLLTMNLCGGSIVLSAQTLNLRQRVIRLSAAALTGALMLGILAPAILCFVRAIQTSSSLSDAPGAWQTPYWTFLGFFEDTFYARLNAAELITLPSVNFAVFLALGWALVRPRRFFAERAYPIMAAVFVFSAALVFAVIPAAAIVRIPVLKSIGHIHNTFSCVMVVLACVGSGLGLANLKTAILEKTWLRDLVLATAIVAIPAAIYFAKTQSSQGSHFQIAYSTSLLITTIALYLGVFRRTDFNRVRAAIVAVVCACVALFVWRHAEYVHTPFDPYVFNPHPRPDLRRPSPAVATINQRAGNEPHRPAGIGLVMLSGYNAMLNWESAFGVDAIFNRYYYELMAAGNITKLFWPAPDLAKNLGADTSSWHEDDMNNVLPVQRLLGIDYYLINPLRPAPQGIDPVAKQDLDVYHDPHAWPRAFFTNRLVAYDDVRELVGIIRRDTKSAPFAAVTSGQYRTLTQRVGIKPGSATEPAHDYELGANATKFSVTAPSAGVIVLMENFLEDDFQVRVNGRVAPYFRVNHAFKAVSVPAAGDYEIEFRYRPKGLNLAEALSAASLLLLLASLIFGLRSGHCILQPQAI